MPTTRLRGLLAALTERLFAVAWGSFASEVEADAALQEAQALERLESAAQRYEADGHPLLADRLRRRAAALTADDPGALGAATLARLAAPADESRALPAATPTPPPKKPRRRDRSTGKRESPSS